MNVSTISIDLAKSVFQLMLFDDQRRLVQEKRLNRHDFQHFMQQHPPCNVVMEACYSANYWGRTCQQLGHQVSLIPAQHVTPFVRGNKNDRNDALAIYEASQRPFIRPVPVKTEAQQEVLMLHRLRERVLAQRIALTNQARGLFSEFGLVFNKGNSAFVVGVQALLDSDDLSTIKRFALLQLQSEYKALTTSIEQIEAQLSTFVRHNEAAQILLSMPGIGLLNASAFAAAIDHGQAFSSAKQFAVWLGLTPVQRASGLKSKTGGIHKRGDKYLRTLLVHGARSLLARLGKVNDDLSRWFNALRARTHINCAIVALAHRLARLMWVLLSRGQHYQARSFINNGTLVEGSDA